MNQEPNLEQSKKSIEKTPGQIPDKLEPTHISHALGEIVGKGFPVESSEGEGPERSSLEVRRDRLNELTDLLKQGKTVDPNELQALRDEFQSGPSSPDEQ